MSDNTITLNSVNFDKETKKGNWIIDFWAGWCGPCKIMAPHFDAAAQEMKGKVKFGKVDVDVEQELAERFEVMSIPTLILIKDGEMIDRSAGAIRKEAIVSKVKESF